MNVNAPKLQDARPLLSSGSAKGPLNVCIASPEFIGLTNHCSIGLAYTAMAQALTAAGHHVTCLYLGAKELNDHAWEHWVEKYRRDGLTLVALPQINASELVAPAHLIKSYETYQWLKKNDRFDIIHFPDRQGPGYHTLMAKHQGLGFARTTICVDLHSMTAWLKAVDLEYVNDLADMDTDFMERRAVALADAVVSPSHYLLNWISDHHLELPKNCYVRPNILPHSAWAVEAPVAPRVREIDELVFFGTLETSKGLILFCDALDSLPPAIADKIQNVTFLGREAIVDGIPARTYLQKRAQGWTFPFQILTGYNSGRAIEFLSQKKRMAIIPSLVENSADEVLSCLVAGIPFVASRMGGIPELIAPDDVSRVCFETKADVLCEVLCRALKEGLSPARALVDARDNEQAWVSLHESSFARPIPTLDSQPAATSPELSSPSPALSNETERTAIQALSIDPSNAVALKVLARIHLNAGLLEAAQEACQLILKDDATDAEALEMMEESKAADTLGEILPAIYTTGRDPEQLQPWIPSQLLAEDTLGQFA
jgi:glycosyltransferase involved in cell wall biosynthesis